MELSPEATGIRQLFAVTRTRGPGWNEALGLEDQEGWKDHAAFMNALAAEGFVVLGGPLAGTPDALLIFRARDEDEIRDRLAKDPWTRSRTLLVTQARPWDLRLGSLPEGR